MARQFAKNILILAASPLDAARLRLDVEVREIQEGLRRANKRRQFNLQQRWAVRVADIQRALLDCKPHMVHFCGHGAGDEGIVLEDEQGNSALASTGALSELFALFPQIECVVLNACYSQIQADAITQHIPYAIGMSTDISDDAALAFAVGFYDALGDGQTLEFAYKFGCNRINLLGIPETLTPILHRSEGGIADRMRRDALSAGTDASVTETLDPDEWLQPKRKSGFFSKLISLFTEDTT